MEINILIAVHVEKKCAHVRFQFFRALLSEYPVLLSEAHSTFEYLTINAHPLSGILRFITQ
jgi:hypothetical protein